MAHITELYVEGLAGRTDPLHLKLNRHVNIFFGLNGSGKTSLLKILHSAMTGKATFLQNVPFTKAQVKIYSITHDTIFTRNCANPVLSVEKTMDEPASLAPTLNVAAGVSSSPRIDDAPPEWDQQPTLQRPATTSWAHRYLPTTRLYLSEETKIRSRANESNLSEEMLEQSFATLVTQIWASYSATILGEIQKAQAGGLADILKAVLGSTKGQGGAPELDPEAAYDRVSRFLERQGSKSILGARGDFQRNYAENPQLRSVVSDINKVESKIQEAVSPRERLQNVITAMFSGNKKVMFTDTSIEIVGINSVKIGLERLSSGEKQLLRILVDTLLTASNSFILDEPEISLHVDWQRELVEIMSQLSPGAQFIIATHSPEIMAEVKDENIFRL